MLRSVSVAYDLHGAFIDVICTSNLKESTEALDGISVNEGFGFSHQRISKESMGPLANKSECLYSRPNAEHLISDTFGLRSFNKSGHDMTSDSHQFSVVYRISTKGSSMGFLLIVSYNRSV
jgi:hypothetical protein